VSGQPLLRILKDGEGDQRSWWKGDWSWTQSSTCATAEACASYPSTTLRAVPLPIFDGEAS